MVASSLETPIRTLSGGNQQKALLARWHLADADVFVLIEPTRGVDVGARADIYRRLDALAEAGKAIVLVSSDLAEVLALADRILVVRDGAIAAETTPAAVDEERLNLLVQGAAAHDAGARQCLRAGGRTWLSREARCRATRCWSRR